MIYLKDISKGSKIHIDDQVLIFNNLDGMFSHCSVEGNDRTVVNLSRNTPLKQVGDHYEIEEA